jgi:predicted transcriptional regulator
MENGYIFSIPMSPSDTATHSRRERQIMEVVYRLGEATAAEIREAIPSPPSYSAVRALLSILEEKGSLKHEQRGRKYVYQPTVAPDRAKRGALKNLLATFFDNSAENLVAALLDPADAKLPKDEIARIRDLIDQSEIPKAK